MTNPLYDQLIAPQMLRGTAPLLHLEDGTAVSGAAFVQGALRLASALSGLGVKPGDRIAVQTEKSAQSLMLYAASLAAGTVFLPLNTGYTAAEVAYFLRDSGAALLVGDPARAEELQGVADGCAARFETLDGAWGGSLAGQGQDGFQVVDRAPGDLAAILYTSGTTGRSKGAMLSQANLLENAKVLTQAWAFTESDVLLHMLPVFHTHGLFVACNVSLLSRGEMIFLAGFSADRAVRWLPKATVMMGVPTFYTRLLDAPEFTRDLVGHMRLFTSGSAPLLAETHVAFEARSGHRILERYGMTETNMSTSNPYDGARRAGTVGPALPGIEVKITDPESGATLPDGTPGMIEVRGPNVFQGYWNMPEKTAEELRPDGFFITGDIGVKDNQGYVTIVGRQKDLIISGGYNIYPKELEMLLDAQPGVLESAVVGVAHPDFGEGVVAVLVRSPGQEPDPGRIGAQLAHDLARFKLPKRYVIVDELPRNTMGKVQKNILRQMFADSFTG